MDQVRKLECELRKTKAVNMQSKKICMITMKPVIDKVEKLRQEVARMCQEKRICSESMKKDLMRLSKKDTTQPTQKL